MDNIAILEYLGYLFVLASFGAAFIAATKATKEKETGKLTKAGKWVIVFIILSFLTSFYIKMQENDLKRDASVKQKEQTDSLIAKLNSIIDSASRSNTKLSEINLKTDTTVNALKVTTENLIGLSQSTQIINSNINKTFLKQSDLFNEQNRIRFQMIRPNFRLEPVTIHYVAIYRMEHPLLEAYADRVLVEYKDYLFKKSNYKYYLRPSEDLRMEGDINYLLNDNKWLPNETNDEVNAKNLLILNNVSFEIKDKNDKIIIYKAPYAMDPYEKDVIDNSKVMLYANFYKRIFIKYIISSSFKKEGNDNISFSSIDLIGRVLSWESVNLGYPNSYIDKIGFQFPYDYQSEDFDRFVDVPSNSTSIVINPRVIGLDEVLNTFSRR